MATCRSCKGDREVKKRVKCTCDNGRVWLEDAYGKPYTNPCTDCRGSGYIHVWAKCSSCGGSGIAAK